MTMTIQPKRLSLELVSQVCLKRSLGSDELNIRPVPNKQTPSQSRCNQKNTHFQEQKKKRHLLHHLLLLLHLQIILLGNIREPPLLRNDDLLSTRELVPRPPESFHDDMCIRIFASDGKDDL